MSSRRRSAMDDLEELVGKSEKGEEVIWIFLAMAS